MMYSSVGRASNRYRRGHGFESHWSLRFIFLGFICNCLGYFITVKITFTCIHSSVILLLFQVTGPATNVVKLAILPENVQAKVVVVEVL